jgi:hypothetical protein
MPPSINSNTMNKLKQHGHNKLIIGLISLMSMLFITSASFESNAQACGMVCVIKRKNKNGDQTTDNLAQL